MRRINRSVGTELSVQRLAGNVCVAVTMLVILTGWKADNHHEHRGRGITFVLTDNNYFAFEVPMKVT
jgi:hypothetical protein